MRNIILKLHGLPPEKQAIEVYDRCYRGDMFMDRQVPWEREFNLSGEYISQDARKPRFQDNIGREIVDTIASFVFSSDKFPSIGVKTEVDVYEGIDLVKKYIDEDRVLKSRKPEIDSMTKEEKKRLQIEFSNSELQRLVSGILTQALLVLPCIKGVKKALVQGKSILAPKLIEGNFYIEVIPLQNITNLVMHDTIPGRIISFTEAYLYEDTDPENKMRKTNFWYRRDFTETKEVEYLPIKEHGNYGLPEEFKWIENKNKKVEHKLGFCPAVLFDNGCSIFAGEVVENIKAFTYFTNNIFKGMKDNMNPQWAVLFNEQAKLNDENFAPRHKGGIWGFVGANSIQSIAPGATGYQEARQLRNELKRDIFRSCGIDYVPEKNQQSGTALAVRMSPMLDKIGEYQILFGDHGLLPLCEMIMRMAIVYNSRGERIKVKNGALIPNSDDFIISLKWGEKRPITEEIIMQAITNALTAYKGGLLDLDHAVNYIAKYFNVIDVEDMLKKLREKMSEVVGGEDAKQMYGRIVHKVNKNNKALAEKGERPEKIEKSIGDIKEKEE